MKSLLVYKFTGASCSSSHIGETCHHFKSRIEDHTKRTTSLIILDIYTPPQYALIHLILFFFKIIDKANSKFDLKVKEALHINWRKPNLNAQQNHLALTLSL